MTTAYTQVSKTRERSQCVRHTLKIKIISAPSCPSISDTVKKDTVLMSPRAAFKLMLNQNQLNLTTALSSILSFFSLSFFTAFLPSPSFFLPCWSSCKCNSGGVVVETHSDTGHSSGTAYSKIQRRFYSYPHLHTSSLHTTVVTDFIRPLKMTFV